MNKKRYAELMADPVGALTEEEIKEGYHFCQDWDGRLIRRDWPAMNKCSCSHLVSSQKKQN